MFLFHVWIVSPPRGEEFRLGWLNTYVFPALQNGVTLFFVLSGFLLFLPFAVAALRDRPRPRFGAYLQNRALRILPAYWCILLLTALVLQTARVYHGHTAAIGELHNPRLLAENALLIQNYRPATIASGIVPAWSLAIEVAFYLLLPLLVVAALWLARRAVTRRQRVASMLLPAVTMTIIGLASAVLGPTGGAIRAGQWSGVWRLSFLTHAHLFAPGLALAVAWAEHQAGRLRLPNWWRPVAAIAGLAIVVAAVDLGVHRTITWRAETGWIAIACGLLVALAVLPPAQGRSRFVGALDTPALVGTGLISYSVYLWHTPVLLWLRTHDLTRGHGPGGFLFNALLGAVAVGGLSWLTYKLVEKPALRLKARSRTMRGERKPTRPARTGRRTRPRAASR